MNFVDQFNQKTDILLERLRMLANGKILVNLFTEFNHATLDAVNALASNFNLFKIDLKSCYSF
jgi:hypothetical protein